MLSRSSFRSALLITVLALLVFGAGRITAQGPTPQTPAAPAAALGTGFTYQGQLKQNGAPVTGACDFQFSLWPTLSGGAQVGLTQSLASVSVAGGLFTVTLNSGGEFEPGAFYGDERYVETAVRCPAGSGAYTTLAPRQPLTAVPYALSLRPGASLESAQPGIVFKARSFAAGGVGVQGMTGSGDGYGGYFTGNNAYFGDNTGAALYTDGDAKQTVSSSGFVKAAVKATCSNTSSIVTRVYNGLSLTTSISNGPFAGFCTIDFGFDISNRFIQVTADSGGTGGARGASVNSVSGNTAQFIRFVPDTGLGENGAIYVLVY